MYWRVVTYNIQHGTGIDGRVDLSRQAALVDGLKPDLVALQEVDRYLPRSRMRHQARVLAAACGLNFTFSANIKWLGFMQYGNAVLSRRPIVAHNYIQLPDERERRGLLVTRVNAEEGDIFFLCVHLGLNCQQRRRQLSIIKQTLTALSGPLILAGDFNTEPGSGEMNVLDGILQPAATGIPTFPAGRPQFTLDNVFFSPQWEVVSTQAIHSPASDHLPLIVTLKLSARRFI